MSAYRGSRAPVPAVVVLAAGLGTRLGRTHPKPLTPLRDGRTILRQQLDHVTAAFDARARVTVVVGFGADQVMAAAAGDASFVFNHRYAETNTAKSLLLALRLVEPGPVLWLNGDVVFEPGLLELLRGHLHTSFVAVDTAQVGEEEVKYTLGPDGYVDALSKQVPRALGEAVGINHLTAADRAVVVEHLAAVRDDDYFEKGLEDAIRHAGLRVRAVDITRFAAVEVDVDDDLHRANALAVPVVRA